MISDDAAVYANFSQSQKCSVHLLRIGCPSLQNCATEVVSLVAMACRSAWTTLPAEHLTV